MTELVPRAMVPLPEALADRFDLVFRAALAEVGCAVRFEGSRVLYPPDYEATINRARILAFDACGLPYEMVPPDEQFSRIEENQK